MRLALLSLIFACTPDLHVGDSPPQGNHSAFVESILQLQFSSATVKAKDSEEGASLPLFSLITQFFENSGQNPGKDSLAYKRLIVNHTEDKVHPLLELTIGIYLLYNQPSNREAFGYVYKALTAFKNGRDISLLKLAYFTMLELYNQEIIQTSDDYLKYLNEYQKLADSPYEKAWYQIHYLSYLTKAVRLDNLNQLLAEGYEDFENYFKDTGLNDRLMVHYFFNMGVYERYLGRNDSAVEHYSNAIKFASSHSFLRYLKFSSLLHLCHIESKSGNFEQAKRYLSQAKENINLSDTVRTSFILNRYSAVYYHEPMGNYETAYEQLLKSSNLEALLDFRRNTLLISELNVKLNTAETENELFLREGQLASRSTWLLVVAILAVLLVVLLIVLLNSRKKIHEKNEKIEVLMRELHHRVKNNLQVISSLLGLQSMKLKDGVAKKAVNEGKERIRAMALIHQKLYQHEEVTSLDICEYINNLVTELVGAYGFSESARVDIQIPRVTLNADTALPVGLLLNELVSNALKYAYEEVDEPILRISMEQESDDSYSLLVSDNGPGLPSDFNIEDSPSFGIKLVTLQVKQLNGALEIVNGPGLSFKINFKSI